MRRDTYASTKTSTIRNGFARASATSAAPLFPVIRNVVVQSQALAPRAARIGERRARTARGGEPRGQLDAVIIATVSRSPDCAHERR